MKIPVNYMEEVPPEKIMTIIQPPATPYRPLFTRLLIGTYLAAFTLTLAFLWLAWDGGRVVQRALEKESASSYTTEVYKAVYEHYFQNVAEPDWSPLSLFVGISNVMNLYIVAPAVLFITTGLLGRRLRARWRWLVIGSTLVMSSLLLWLAPSLRALSVLLD